MQLTHPEGVRAARFFALLALVFVVCFGAMVALLALDQQRVIETTSRLQEQTVPEIIRYQRLARNLEQLRQEGERVFAATNVQSRQQAMFVVTLVASHPSVLEHPDAAQIARQAERFLGEVVRQAAKDGKTLDRNYEEWQHLAARLGLLIDDVSIQGINLANTDLVEVASHMRLARYKLIAVMLVVGLFLAGLLFGLRSLLIHPLQRIYTALSNISVDRPAPEFRPSRMLEIRAVEQAIGQLHASLLKNEDARQVLENLANKDGLTGLINRRYFMSLADAELQRAQRYQRPVTVGMADLDFFKKLNDTYGHAAGDTVLRAFAELTLDTLRQSDIVCRYGGEEFAFIFPESTLAEAGRLAERYRARCEAQDIRLPDGQLVRVTMSMGLADAGSGSLEAVLGQADEALYAAKHQGRNCVVSA